MISYKPLKELLKEKGVTLLELEERIGYSEKTIRRATAGESNLGTDVLYAICMEFQCDIKDVIEYTEEVKVREDKSRVNVDWELISESVKSHGTSLNKIAVEIGRGINTFTNMRRENRAICMCDLEKICKLIGEESSKFIK